MAKPVPFRSLSKKDQDFILNLDTSMCAPGYNCKIYKVYCNDELRKVIQRSLKMNTKGMNRTQMCDLLKEYKKVFQASIKLSSDLKDKKNAIKAKEREMTELKRSQINSKDSFQILGLRKKQKDLERRQKLLKNRLSRATKKKDKDNINKELKSVNQKLRKVRGEISDIAANPDPYEVRKRSYLRQGRQVAGKMKKNEERMDYINRRSDQLNKSKKLIEKEQKQARKVMNAMPPGPGAPPPGFMPPPQAGYDLLSLENTRLKRQLNDKQMLLEETRARIKEIEEDILAGENASIEKMKKELASFRSANTKLQKQVDKLKIKEAELKRAKSDNKVLSQRLKAFMKGNVSNSGSGDTVTIKSLEQMNKDLAREKSQIEKTLRDLEGEYATLSLENDQNKDTIKDLKAEVKQLKKDCSASGADVSKIRAQLSTAQDELSIEKDKLALIESKVKGGILSKIVKSTLDDSLEIVEAEEYQKTIKKIQKLEEVIEKSKAGLSEARILYINLLRYQVENELSDDEVFRTKPIMSQSEAEAAKKRLKDLLGLKPSDGLNEIEEAMEKEQEIVEEEVRKKESELMNLRSSVSQDTQAASDRISDLESKLRAADTEIQSKVTEIGNIRKELGIPDSADPATYLADKTLVDKAELNLLTQLETYVSSELNLDKNSSQSDFQQMKDLVIRGRALGSRDIDNIELELSTLQGQVAGLDLAAARAYASEVKKLESGESELVPSAELRKLEEARNKVVGLEAQVNDLDIKAATAKNAAKDLNDEIGQLKNDIRAINAQKAQAEADLKSANSEKLKIKAELAAEKSAKANEIVKATTANREMIGMRGSKEAAERQAREAEREAARAEAEVKRLEARVKALESAPPPVPTPVPVPAPRPPSPTGCSQELQQLKEEYNELKLLDIDINKKLKLIIDTIYDRNSSKLKEDKDINIRNLQTKDQTKANLDEFLEMENKLQTVQNVLNSITEQKLNSFISSGRRNNCTEIQNKLGEISTISNAINKDNINLVLDAFEDIAGIGRVYVRLLGDKIPSTKGTKKFASVINQKFIKLESKEGFSNPKGTGYFGPFTAVFDNEGDTTNRESGKTRPVNNETIYEDSIKSKIENMVKVGYNTITMTYGQSGTGKTFTLFGDPKNNIPGIIHYSLRTVTQNNNVKKICPSFFQLYSNGNTDSASFYYNPTQDQVNTYYETKKSLGKPVRMIDSIRALKLENDNRTKFDGIFNNVVDKRDDVFKFKLDYEDAFYDKDKNSNITQDQLFNKINNLINKTLRARPTRSTVANTESSRSHLFMVFRIELDDGNSHLLSFIDLGGNEDTSGEPLATKIEGDVINESLVSISDFLKRYSNGLTEREFITKKPDGGSVSGVGAWNKNRPQGGINNTFMEGKKLNYAPQGHKASSLNFEVMRMMNTLVDLGSDSSRSKVSLFLTIYSRFKKALGTDNPTSVQKLNETIRNTTGIRKSMIQDRALAESIEKRIPGTLQLGDIIFKNNE